MAWSWRKRPGIDFSQLPASPPDPQAAHTQAAANQARIHQEWLQFIADEVLPCVNAALWSPSSVEYKPRMLVITGTQRGVTVYNPYKDLGLTWQSYLIAALDDNPAYENYKISFLGIRDTGAHWRSGGPFHEEVPLSRDNLDESAQAFIKSSHDRAHSFRVTIEP